MLWGCGIAPMPCSSPEDYLPGVVRYLWQRSAEKGVELGKAALIALGKDLFTVLMVVVVGISEERSP